MRQLAQDWLKYDPDGFTLHSGNTSNFLIDSKMLFRAIPLRDVILSYWNKALEEYQPPYYVFGIPTGGTSWAEALVSWTDAVLITDPVSTLRAETDLSGNVNRGTYVVVDDVVTTGKSLQEQNADVYLAVALRGLIKTDKPLYAWMILNLEGF